MLPLHGLEIRFTHVRRKQPVRDYTFRFRKTVYLGPRLDHLGGRQYVLVIGAGEISTLTAPVFDRSGRVALALTLGSFERGMTSQEIDALGQHLLRAARAIARVRTHDTE